MNVSAAASQSPFITGLAWVAIAFNGLGAFIALMQNIMINLVMPTMLAGSNASPGAALPLAIFRVFAAVFLGVTIFMTYAGYGLLMRRNWARRTFIVVCALSVAWTVLCILMFALGFGLGHVPTSGPGTVPPEMRSMFNLMFGMSSIFALGMCVLFIWIIRRLRSPAIKAEFN